MIILKGDQQLPSDELNALVDKIKAIVYARVSTEDQVKGYSLDSQIEICANKAKKDYGYKDDEIIAIVELGVSGDNSNRPAINYALHLLENGIGRKMFVLHPDRLARDLYLQMQFTRRVWSYGCDIEFIESAVDKNNPESMLMFNIQGSIAQYNKAKILANSKRGRRAKAKSGKISGLRRVYGYNFDYENDILVPNEFEKEVYLSMVDMLLNQNMSCSQIAAELSKQNIPAPNGNVWYQASVSRILKNETYTGKFYYGKTEIVQHQGLKIQTKKPKEEWIKIDVPAYIDEATYEAILDRINNLNKNKGGRPSEDYLLRGIAKCGRCGSPVASGITSRSGSNLLKYYSCIRKAKKGYVVGTSETSHVLCKGKNWRVDIVDNHVWNVLLNIIKNPVKLIEKIASRNNEVEKLSEYKAKQNSLIKSIKEKEKMKERYIDLYASGIIKDKKSLEEKINSVEEQIQDLTDNLNVIEESIKFITESENKEDRVISILNKFNEKITNSEEITHDLKRSIIEILVHKVILYDDGTIDVQLNFFDDDPDSTHKNLNSRQDEGLCFYVSFETAVTAREKRIEKKYEHLIPKFNEIKNLYYNELLTYQEIADKLNVQWWEIRELFKDFSLKKIHPRERARLKRKKDFDFFYKLHIENKLSLAEIYKIYKKSPPYVRQVLREGGVNPINYGRYDIQR